VLENFWAGLTLSCPADDDRLWGFPVGEMARASTCKAPAAVKRPLQVIARRISSVKRALQVIARRISSVKRALQVIARAISSVKHTLQVIARAISSVKRRLQVSAQLFKQKRDG